MHKDSCGEYLIVFLGFSFLFLLKKKSMKMLTHKERGLRSSEDYFKALMKR